MNVLLNYCKQNMTSLSFLAGLKEYILENYFLYFLSKTNVVGTQKNRLHETVLLSTQNTCLN